MSTGIDYKDAISNMQAEVNKLTLRSSDVDKTLKQIGKVVKSAIEFTAPMSTGRRTTKHIVHDVTYKLKTSKASGQRYVSVRGGKETGWKWEMVNDGHVALNGKFIPGNHFVDKAVASCEREVDSIIEARLREIL